MRIGIETMHPDITAMKRAMSSVDASLDEVSDVVEPLEGATKRIGRFADRHDRSSRRRRAAS